MQAAPTLLFQRQRMSQKTPLNQMWTCSTVGKNMGEGKIPHGPGNPTNHFPQDQKMGEGRLHQHTDPLVAPRTYPRALYPPPLRRLPTPRLFRREDQFDLPGLDPRNPQPEYQILRSGHPGPEGSPEGAVAPIYLAMQKHEVAMLVRPGSPWGP